VHVVETEFLAAVVAAKICFERCAACLRRRALLGAAKAHNRDLVPVSEAVRSALLLGEPEEPQQLMEDGRRGIPLPNAL